MQQLQSEQGIIALNLLWILGVNGTIRASFYLYNDDSDAEIFLAGIDRVLEVRYDLACINQEIIEEFQEIDDQFERLEVLMDFQAKSMNYLSRNGAILIGQRLPVYCPYRG